MNVITLNGSRKLIALTNLIQLITTSITRMTARYKITQFYDTVVEVLAFKEKVHSFIQRGKLDISIIRN